MLEKYKGKYRMSVDGELFDTREEALNNKANKPIEKLPEDEKEIANDFLNDKLEDIEPKNPEMPYKKHKNKYKNY